jgi:hypothetical protein
MNAFGLMAGRGIGPFLSVNDIQVTRSFRTIVDDSGVISGPVFRQRHTPVARRKDVQLNAIAFGRPYTKLAAIPLEQLRPE